MTTENSAPRRERPNLDARYGKIGISAVAAAVKYHGEPRTQAEVPLAPSLYERFEEEAAA